MKICEDAGVKLIYLPPYSPHMNPIEEFLLNLRDSFGVTGITTKKTLRADLLLSLNGVLVWWVQRKKVLKAIFDMQG